MAKQTRKVFYPTILSSKKMIEIRDELMKRELVLGIWAKHSGIAPQDCKRVAVASKLIGRYQEIRIIPMNVYPHIRHISCADRQLIA